MPLTIRLRPGPPTKAFRGSADDNSKWGRIAIRALAVPNPKEELRMSVPAILNALFQIPDFLPAKSNANTFKQEFQQLGQDLRSGNLSQAQSDLAAFQPSNVPAPFFSLLQRPSINCHRSQIRNLSAAQQDYATVQQDLQSSAASGHHHHHSAGSDTSSSSQNSLEQFFSQLGQDLQSGNLSQAQSAYASLQQEFAQLGSALSTASTSASSNALNVTV